MSIRNIFHLIVFSAFTVLTVACSGNGSPYFLDDEPVPVQQDILEVSPKSLYFTYNPTNSQRITITSNVNWQVSNKPSWVTVESTTTRADSQTMEVTVTENTSEESRDGTIIISATGISSVSPQQVSISQDGKPATVLSLSVDPQTLSFSAEPESKTVKITSNTSWTITSDQQWCKVNKNTGSNNDQLSVSVDENTDITERTATITFTYGDAQEEKISITQASRTTPIEGDNQTPNLSRNQ